MSGEPKGLQVSILSSRNLENLATIGSEYYLPQYVQDQETLRKSGHAIQTLGSLCAITDGDHGSADYQEYGVGFVLSENVKEGWIDAHALRRISYEHHRTLPRSSLKPDDVLVTKTGVYFGRSAVVDHSLGEANTIAHVGILRLKKNLDPYFLSTFLNSRYGQSQLRRRSIKATRPEIKLVEFKDIEVAIPSREFQRRIREACLRSGAIRAAVDASLRSAEEILLLALGLAAWKPPEPLSYVARAVDAVAAGRIDARFFAPRIQALLDILSRDGRAISDIAELRQERFQPNRCDTFHYIEIGDLDGAGAAGSTQLACSNALSRATWHVRSNDVITSTVRPVRRLSAQIDPKQDGFVCSSGFVVMRPHGVGPELLLTYLRLPAVCELLDLYASASMYPAVTDAHILGLPVPKIDASVEAQVATKVSDAKAARVQAARHLEAAKQAVEIAIVGGEDAASAFVDRVEGVDG